jgi:hypothetical protein
MTGQSQVRRARLRDRRIEPGRTPGRGNDPGAHAVEFSKTAAPCREGDSFSRGATGRNGDRRGPLSIAPDRVALQQVGRRRGRRLGGRGTVAHRRGDGRRPTVAAGRMPGLAARAARRAGRRSRGPCSGRGKGSERGQAVSRGHRPAQRAPQTRNPGQRLRFRAVSRPPPRDCRPRRRELAALKPPAAAGSGACRPGGWRRRAARAAGRGRRRPAPLPPASRRPAPAVAAPRRATCRRRRR